MPEGGFDQFIAMHKAGIEAFNRGDLDAALATFPEDAEWHSAAARSVFGHDPEASGLRGPDAVKRFFEELRSVFDEWRSEPLEYEEVREGTALVHQVLRGTSRGAGVPIEFDTWDLWEVDTETLQPVRVRQFPSRADALEAARIDA
jgi:ketosteroid isomerase-like protein